MPRHVAAAESGNMLPHSKFGYNQRRSRPAGGRREDYTTYPIRRRRIGAATAWQGSEKENQKSVLKQN